MLYGGLSEEELSLIDVSKKVCEVVVQIFCLV